MTDGLEIGLSLVMLLSSLPLIALSARLYKALTLVDARLDPALGFLLLALGQAAGALGILAEGRISYTLYAATSYLEAAGFMALVEGSKGRGVRAFLLLPLLIPLAGDAWATASSFYASYRFQSAARAITFMVGAAFSLRLTGLLLAPSLSGTALLVSGELARAASLAVLSLVYGRS